MSEFDEMNREVIAEFRANDGVVDTAAGGYFKGKPMLILHTTGAKTGASAETPLMYLDEGDDASSSPRRAARRTTRTGTTTSRPTRTSPSRWAPESTRRPPA